MPEPARPILLGYLEDFASRDYYDDRHRFIRDGRTYEERQKHTRRMQPHYRIVCERLLCTVAVRYRGPSMSRLKSSPATDFS